jgi:hypothetical protein
MSMKKLACVLLAVAVCFLAARPAMRPVMK